MVGAVWVTLELSNFPITSYVADSLRSRCATLQPRRAPCAPCLVLTLTARTPSNNEYLVAAAGPLEEWSALLVKQVRRGAAAAAAAAAAAYSLRSSFASRAVR